MSVPPGPLVSYLLSASSRCTNGLAVFVFVVVAAFGVEWLRRADRRLAIGLLAVTLLGPGRSLVYAVWHRGVFSGDLQLAP